MNKAAKQTMFTLGRDKVIRGIFGHAIEFKKGEPTHVPREMWETVQAAGAIPVEDLVEEEKPANTRPTDPGAAEDAIFEAFAKMVAENKRESFTGTGIPDVKALEKVVGFSVDKKECGALWQKFKTKDNEK